MAGPPRDRARPLTSNAGAPHKATLIESPARTVLVALLHRTTERPNSWCRLQRSTRPGCSTFIARLGDGEGSRVPSEPSRAGSCRPALALDTSREPRYGMARPAGLHCVNTPAFDREHGAPGRAIPRRRTDGRFPRATVNESGPVAARMTGATTCELRFEMAQAHNRPIREYL
jgi:hypothetical protein